MLPVGILNKAVETAEKSNYYPYKIGSVIFKGKRILSCGFNAIRSCSSIADKYRKTYESLHAEQHAIMQIKNKNLLHNASMIIIRINLSGNLSLARPCRMCMKSILFFHLKEIYYSDRKGQIILEKLNFGK